MTRPYYTNSIPYLRFNLNIVLVDVFRNIKWPTRIVTINEKIMSLMIIVAKESFTYVRVCENKNFLVYISYLVKEGR